MISENWVDYRLWKTFFKLEDRHGKWTRIHLKWIKKTRSGRSGEALDDETVLKFFVPRGSFFDVCSMALACSSRPPAVSIGSKRVPRDPSRRLANQWKIFSPLSMSGKVYRSLPANGSIPDVVRWHGCLDVWRAVCWLDTSSPASLLVKPDEIANYVSL